MNSAKLFFILVIVSIVLASCIPLATGIAATKVKETVEEKPAKYTLAVISDYGSPAPSGTLQYKKGSLIEATVDAIVDADSSTRYVCTGYVGTGSAPAEGTENSVSFNITEDSTIIWSWKLQHYLTIESDYGDPQGAGWYDYNTSVEWSVTSPCNEENGSRFVTSTSSGEVLVDAPKTITVEWTIQYKLTVSVNDDSYGTVSYSGESWHNAGSSKILTATANTVYKFSNWSGDLTGNENPATITINSCKNITAVFAVDDSKITNTIGMVFKLIPAGTFLMGSPDSDPNADADEKPQHTVNITQPFYLGIYEVTQAQWQEVMGNNPSYFKGDNLPIEKVSWDDIQLFLTILSNREGIVYRLPTEAEWEYACR
ncbi:MAG: SUMF1/EgtB/PvdO family nonheme iron enzyme, partial [Planctomycetota bacterium]